MTMFVIATSVLRIDEGDEIITFGLMCRGEAGAILCFKASKGLHMEAFIFNIIFSGIKNEQR